MSSEGAAPLVSFEDVTKRFGATGRRDLLRDALPIERRDQQGILAVDHASFTVPGGQALGIVGSNGAGKSTLLKLAAGILEPTGGHVEVAGVPASMIELGLSFHPDLTGWENLPVAAALFGLSQDEFGAIRDDVVAFSGIEQHLDLPVKHFSSGMVARLGFALATHLPSQVLLIDEVLAVGDRTFQLKCIERIRHMVRSDVAVLFVSHSPDLVVQICDRVIWIDKGRVVADGEATEVVTRYLQSAKSPIPADGRKTARFTAFDLPRPEIESGDMLPVTCTVEVDDATTPLFVRSEIIVPPAGSGAFNVDEMPEGALRDRGSWDLASEVGPMVVTAGKLELSLWLQAGQGDDAVVLDRVTAPYLVRGEDVGVIRVAFTSTWSAGPAAPPAVAAAARPLELKDAVAWADGVGKVFDNRHLSAGGSRGSRVRAREHGRSHALDDVSFAIGAGEAVGLIGPNGAGKSTLLRVLAGVSGSTSGTHGTRGRVAAVLELGTAFHGDLTGGENLEFSWRLHEGEPERWAEAFRAIEAFADIGPVLNMQLKRYSTGMKARLALALALELRPDVLLIDEALSVGDAQFRERVRIRLGEMVEAGTAVLFASHDLHLLRTICSRVVRLDEGRLIDDGPTDQVIADAGGAGWAGGTSTADGGVVLKEVRPSPDVLGWNEPFGISIDVEVVRPTPSAYLEFSIRETLPLDERSRPRTPDEVLTSTIALHRVELPADVFGTVGTKTITGAIEGMPILSFQDVVLSVIDEIDGSVLTEQWRTVFFGAEGEAGTHARAIVPWTATSR